MTDLKPCPFCASNCNRLRNSSPVIWWYECFVCGAHAAFAATADLAANAWNTRAPATPSEGIQRLVIAVGNSRRSLLNASLARKVDTAYDELTDAERAACGVRDG